MNAEGKGGLPGEPGNPEYPISGSRYAVDSGDHAGYRVQECEFRKTEFHSGEPKNQQGCACPVYVRLNNKNEDFRKELRSRRGYSSKEIKQINETS